MTIPPEVWIAAIYGGLLLLAGVGRYLTRKKEAPKPPDSMLAAIGLEFGTREQGERVIAELKRIADTLADKKQHEIDDKLDELLERMDKIKPPGRR